jgi:hypothetical protein
MYLLCIESFFGGYDIWWIGCGSGSIGWLLRGFDFAYTVSINRFLFSGFGSGAEAVCGVERKMDGGLWAFIRIDMGAVDVVESGLCSR